MKNSYKISPRWSAHKQDPKEKEEFNKLVKAADIVLERLDTLIKQELTDVTKTDKVDYDSPSWSHKQAHLNGMQDAYSKILNLTNHVIKEIE
jgi:hypothetical protein